MMKTELSPLLIENCHYILSYPMLSDYFTHVVAQSHITWTECRQECKTIHLPKKENNVRVCLDGVLETH